MPLAAESAPAEIVAFQLRLPPQEEVLGLEAASVHPDRRREIDQHYCEWEDVLCHLAHGLVQLHHLFALQVVEEAAVAQLVRALAEGADDGCPPSAVAASALDFEATPVETKVSAAAAAVVATAAACVAAALVFSAAVTALVVVLAPGPRLLPLVLEPGWLYSFSPDPPH